MNIKIYLNCKILTKKWIQIIKTSNVCSNLYFKHKITLMRLKTKVISLMKDKRFQLHNLEYLLLVNKYHNLKTTLTNTQKLSYHLEKLIIDS